MSGPVDVVVRVDELTVDVPGRRLLDRVALEIRRGETVAVMGPSGSGKTTLLNCVAGLLIPARGSVRVGDVDMASARAEVRAAQRLSKVATVFQFGELLPELTAGENVALPLLLRAEADARATARRWLSRVGLDGRYDDSPQTLSGGEVQRVGIARALAGRPAIVLADEPTGALDRGTADEVTELLISAAREHQAAVLVATHDQAVADRADRIVQLRDGRLSADETQARV